MTPPPHPLNESRSSLAEPHQDHRVLKLACRWIAGPGKRRCARMLERERACPPLGNDRTHDLTSFTGLQIAFPIPDQTR
jgi:hypothetical protein